MQQYPLPLTLATVYRRDNFAVSDCNNTAFRFIESWPNWPSHALLIYGPAGCGKTHLAHIWAAASHAAFLDASLLEYAPQTPLVIERLETLGDETPLFHLLNRCKEEHRPLLLTGIHAPKAYGFTLPDLVSRLAALPCAAIDAPDDAALSAALRKQFSDRQLKIDDTVIEYMIARMPRAFASAQKLVATLDKLALEQKKTITIPFVKQILADIFIDSQSY